MSISIAGLWRGGRELAEAHAPTVVPIAAAFIFLPQLIWAVIAGPTDPQATGFAPPGALGAAITGLLAFIGQAAVVAIMLGGTEGPRDVADALRRGLQLVPRILLVLLILVAIAAPLFFIAALVAALFIGGGDQAAALRILRVLMPVILIAALYVGGRLFLLIPVLIAEQARPRQAISRSWRLTAAQPWTLIGFMLTWILALLFLTSLVTLVSEGLFGLLLGSNSRLGFLLTTTFVTLVATVLSLITNGASVTAYRSVDRRLP